MIKNIFFDFDGVLAESVHIKTQAFYQMYLPFGQQIAQKVVAYHQEHGGISRYEKFKVFHKQFLGLYIDETKVQELALQFSNLVKEGVIQSPEVNGATYFLEKYLPQLQYWIITGTPTVEILPIVKARGITHYFKGIHGSPQKKTYWTEYLLNKHQLKKEETLFLGDALTDYKAALHSQLHFAWRENEESQAYFENYSHWRFQNFYDLERLLSNNGYLI